MNHPTHDEVARLAYELFLSRGQAHGRDLDDWLEAERQVSEPRSTVQHSRTGKRRVTTRTGPASTRTKQRLVR